MFLFGSGLSLDASVMCVFLFSVCFCFGSGLSLDASVMCVFLFSVCFCLAVVYLWMLV